MAKRTTEERFWAKVERADADSCWLWQGSRQSHGYGLFWCSQKRGYIYAHRWSMAQQLGRDLAPGEHVDHICHTTSCVNPGHLRAVTHLENLENHSGPISTNTSGFRGVYFDRVNRKWVAQYRSADPSKAMMRRYSTKEEAASAIVEHRNRVLVYNDLDRRSGEHPRQ